MGPGVAKTGLKVMSPPTSLWTARRLASNSFPGVGGRWAWHPCEVPSPMLSSTQVTPASHCMPQAWWALPAGHRLPRHHPNDNDTFTAGYTSRGWQLHHHGALLLTRWVLLLLAPKDGWVLGVLLTSQPFLHPCRLAPTSPIRHKVEPSHVMPARLGRGSRPIAPVRTGTLWDSPWNGCGAHA